MATHCEVSVLPSPRLRAGCEVIYEVGEAGQTWRLISGIVRLDRDDVSGPQFASLALAAYFWVRRSKPCHCGGGGSTK